MSVASAEAPFMVGESGASRLQANSLSEPLAARTPASGEGHPSQMAAFASPLSSAASEGPLPLSRGSSGFGVSRPSDDGWAGRSAFPREPQIKAARAHSGSRTAGLLSAAPLAATESACTSTPATLRGAAGGEVAAMPSALPAPRAPPPVPKTTVPGSLHRPHEAARPALGFQAQARAEDAAAAGRSVFDEVALASRAALRTETPPAGRPRWVDGFFRVPEPQRTSILAAGAGYGALGGGEDDVWDRGLLGPAAAAAPGSPVAKPRRGAAPAAHGGEAAEAGRLLALPAGVLRGTHADDVLARVYEYFFEGGFAVAVASRVLSAAVLLFTIVFSAFVVAGVRWAELASCRQGGPEDCRDLGRFASWSFLRSPQGWQGLVVAYVVALGAYWAWSVAVLPSSVARFWGTGRFYRHVLGVSDDELPAAPWEHVAARLEAAVREGRLPMQLGHRWGRRAGDQGAGEAAGAADGAGPAARLAEPGPGRACSAAASDVDAGERLVSSEHSDGRHVGGASSTDGLGAPSGLPAAPGGSVGLEGSHEVACRITRRDDFLVALAADGELDVDADVSCPVTPTSCRRWAWSSRVFRHSWRMAVRLCAAACDAVPEDVDVSGPTSAELREQGVPDDEAGASGVGVPSGRRPRQPGPGDAGDDDSDSDSDSDSEEEDEATRVGPDGETGRDPGVSSRRACRLRRGWLTAHLSLPLTHVTASYARFALINPLFGPDMRARKVFLHRPRSLRWCLRGLGLLHLVALPFSLTFAAVFWVISLAEEARSSSNYLGARVWSPQARWLFREYGELPHALDRRCATAVPKAHAFLRQFPSPLLALAGRATAFVAGALLLSLLASTLLVDEDLLTDMHLGGRNLLWYVAVLSGAVAAGRSLIPAPEDTAVSPAAAMAELASLTHHYPDSWRGREHTPRVRRALDSLFPNRAVVVLRELAALLLAPVLLCVVLPRRADRILRRLDGLLVSVPGLGDVCRHSLLGRVDPGAATGRPVAVGSGKAGPLASGAALLAHAKPATSAEATGSDDDAGGAARLPASPASTASTDSASSLRQRAAASRDDGPGRRNPAPPRRPPSPRRTLPSERKAGRAVASFHCQNPAWSASVHGARDVPPASAPDGAAAMESSAVEAMVFSRLHAQRRDPLLASVMTEGGWGDGDDWVRAEAAPAKPPAAPRDAPRGGWGATPAAAERLAARSRLAIMAALAGVMPVLGGEQARRVAQRARDEMESDAQRGGGEVDQPAAGGVGVGPMLRQFQRL